MNLLTNPQPIFHRELYKKTEYTLSDLHDYLKISFAEPMPIISAYVTKEQLSNYRTRVLTEAPSIPTYIQTLLSNWLSEYSLALILLAIDFTDATEDYYPSTAQLQKGMLTARNAAMPTENLYYDK